MAKYLYRLGKWAADNRKKVLLGACGVLVVLVVLALSMGPSFSDKMTIPGTESQKASKLLTKAFPSTKNAKAQVQVLFKAPKHKTLESKKERKIISETINDIKKDKAVSSVASPVVLQNYSKNKRIGYALVTYKSTAKKVSEISKKKILNVVKKARKAGIQTELAGDVSFSSIEVGGVTEGIGVLVAYLVLAVTFTSFLAAGMPILTALIGLGIGLMGIITATNYMDIASYALSLSAMLGLAVAIDYALFIITRFRRELGNGYSIKESVGIAIGTAGNAVVFAGMTVVVALLGLSVAKIPFLTMMGLSAAFSVFIAILVAILVVPALLGLIGGKIGPSRQNRLLKRLSRVNKKADSSGWGNFVTTHPLLVTILSVAILISMSTPVFHMNLGLPDNGMKSKVTMDRRAYDLQTEAYGKGVHAPLVILAQTSTKTKNAQEAMNATVKELRSLANVKSVTPAAPSSLHRVSMISLIPKTGPNDPKTSALVHAIRKKSMSLQKSQHVKLYVTGATAVNLDISQKLSDALPGFCLLIAGFAFILLVVVFRSILIPLKAVLGFILSLAATLGFLVFAIQDGHLISMFGFPTSGPILSFLPVIVVGILFGLAMDYEVFLVSRMREGFIHSGDTKKSVLIGMRESGSVVTAAGLIMVAVFAGFMMTSEPIIKSMGLSLTVGVLFDAFIVRMTMVPAVITLMGKSAWYLPKWLDKLLPDIDIEGKSILEEEQKRKKIS
ncbi:MMPL family transporter [Sporolactobacillus spathodeae]|uniref:Membrane protein YdfJ n=1 Tax=Sporolactobacillus spathodeae TaxID=1465502 RepID=A0ABS2Q5E4_9BACL|nr:MMPL family transporter [Sporolactobacillus spathodeae]MBM7656831.1 membrane protein YdfJ [Sporolactobacillus spathodeae]